MFQATTHSLRAVKAEQKAARKQGLHTAIGQRASGYELVTGTNQRELHEAMVQRGFRLSDAEVARLNAADRDAAHIEALAFNAQA